MGGGYFPRCVRGQSDSRSPHSPAVCRPSSLPPHPALTPSHAFPPKIFSATSVLVVFASMSPFGICAGWALEALTTGVTQDVVSAGSLLHFACWLLCHIASRLNRLGIRHFCVCCARGRSHGRIQHLRRQEAKICMCAFSLPNRIPVLFPTPP